MCLIYNIKSNLLGLQSDVRTLLSSNVLNVWKMQVTALRVARPQGTNSPPEWLCARQTPQIGSHCLTILLSYCHVAIPLSLEFHLYSLSFLLSLLDIPLYLCSEIHIRPIQNSLFSRRCISPSCHCSTGHLLNNEFHY